MTTVHDNPLLNVGFRIPFDRIEPRHAQSAVDQLIHDVRERLQQLTLAPSAAFLAQLDDLTRELDVASGVVRHLESVVSNDAWREAYNAVVPKLSALHSEIALSDELWAALKRFEATPEARGLSGEHARFLQLTLDEFRRGGADLPAEKKARLRDVNVRLAELGAKFGQNVLDDVAGYELYVGEERLDGVPQRTRRAAREEAQARGRDGYRLTLHMPVREAVLKHARDRELRRELWAAFDRVATAGRTDNRPIIRELLELRREKARILGYGTFADLKLEDRMARSGEQALSFVRDLEAKVRPHFEREQAELEAFYRERAGQDAPALEAWDVGFWAERMREVNFDLNDEDLRPYFAIDGVLSGMFEITRRVFGVRVEEAQAPGWHPEVKYYNVFNRDGQHVASFYTDWFPRDSKRGGAWMQGLITGGPNDEGFEAHLGLMAGNLTPPSGDTPALLSHREVETLFHEFGHLLHHALSRVQTRSLSGTNVAWDFVELPSQIMENWTWERESLDVFARHHVTGERIPDDLYAKMLAARNHLEAHGFMRQLSFGLVDLSLHTEYDGQQDVLEYARNIMAPMQPTRVPDDYAFITAFSHIFAGGYAAGYYSYKWAEVLDADAFSRFLNEGIFNEQTGAAFVDAVLARGNSEDPAALYREFMGRDPDPVALLRRAGMLA